MVSLFHQQVVLEITFRSIQLGPLAFCDNKLSSFFLFKGIKMSNSSLLSYLGRGTLIFDGVYWNVSLVYFFFLLLHVILCLQHFIWRRASVNCLFASGENIMVNFFLNLGYKSFGKQFSIENSLFDHNFLKNAFVWKTWTWCHHLRQCAGQGG